MKVNIKKVLSEYICRQLKYHGHRIRSKISISLEIILNVFNCLIVPLVPSTKILTLTIAPFLFIFVDIVFEFAMVTGVYIFLSPQEEEVHLSSWRHRCTHSAAHSSKRVKLLLCHVTIPRLLLNWEKHKQEIQLCYGGYSETKQHFEILILLWFQ